MRADYVTTHGMAKPTITASDDVMAKRTDHERDGE
jgi:hypothetical protein